jgi:PPM family protein phosphatase
MDVQGARMAEAGIGSVAINGTALDGTALAQAEQMPVQQPLLEFAAATDRGRVRRVNEDAWGAHLDEGAFVVCDGMGGAAAGETASRMAAEELLASLAHTEAECEAGPTQMAEGVRRANAAVFAAAQGNRRLAGMGTTLVALRVHGSQAWVVHVGDSRCYLYRAGELRRMTRDHSLVEEQMRMGRMTREQARRSPMQNVITRAVGTREGVEPEVQELALESGDIVLLATDGLTRELTDAAIGAIVGEAVGGDLDQVCRRLTDAANRAGGADNITCLLVRYRPR